MQHAAEQYAKALEALVFLEEKVEGLDCLCRVVDRVNMSNPPDWLYLVWSMSRDIEAALAPVSESVRTVLKTEGEGPRSGGGEATSGAGAKRKEGVQPPGDVSAMGVRS